VFCNQIAQDLGDRTDLTFATVEGQMGHLLQYDVPTFYVSKELLAAASRTDLPGELHLDAIPFPFPAASFHAAKRYDSTSYRRRLPYVVVSRMEKGQVTK
jgi:hypothetical protein